MNSNKKFRRFQIKITRLTERDVKVNGGIDKEKARKSEKDRESLRETKERERGERVCVCLNESCLHTFLIRLN